MSALAIVLAAGRGERLGGPKALLAWPGKDGDEPLALAHARARLAGECRRVLVVVRAPVAAALARHQRAGEAIELVVSEADDALGPAGSIAAASTWLRDHDPRHDVAVVGPVDMPPVSARTVAWLARALRTPPHAVAARPRFEGRRGHPVLLRAALVARYHLPDPPPLRELLASLGDAVRDVPVTDRDVVADFDTPSELGRPLRFFT